MGLEAPVLQALMMKIRGWLPVIQRSTYADKVEISPGSNGTFYINSGGDNKDGTRWEFSRHFDNEHCFNGSLPLSVQTWSVKQRPCDFAREYIKDVLTHRGVIL